MIRTMLKSKIHRAVVTMADVDYVGSITVDADLMAAADLLANEAVHVLDITNGARLETYVIPGAARLRGHRHQRCCSAPRAPGRPGDHRELRRGARRRSRRMAAHRRARRRANRQVALGRDSAEPVPSLA